MNREETDRLTGLLAKYNARPKQRLTLDELRDLSNLQRMELKQDGLSLFPLGEQAKP